MNNNLKNEIAKEFNEISSENSPISVKQNYQEKISQEIKNGELEQELSKVDDIPPDLKVDIENSDHSKILDSILEKIEPVDFLKETNLDDPKKLQTKHYVVVIIEKVLMLAKILRLNLCISDNFIYGYNSKYWAVLSREYIKYFLGRAAEKAGITKHTAKYYSFKSKLFNQMMADAQLIKPSENSSMVLVNFKNGTLEITTERKHFRDFRSDDFLKYQLPFDYNPKAEAPMFKKFLNEVLPDVSSQMVLSEFFGYVFIPTSYLKMEKAIVLYGTGANGKSVIYDLINAMLGSTNISNYSLDNLMDSKGYHRAMLVNKLLNYTSEMNGDVESNMFKQLASGEGVEARQIYCQPTIITNYAKLAFNCNVLPKNVEHTNAYFRRFIIIPFLVTILENKQDKQLAQKIIAAGELTGIFNWVLEGLARLLVSKKFTESEIIDAELTKYKIESDNVKMFLDDSHFVETIDRYMSVKHLSNMYSEYCKEDRYRPLNHSNFVKRLRALNLRVEKRNTGLVIFVEQNIPNEKYPTTDKPIITPFAI